MRRVDIGVVGAGPAGAWAAYCLARAGARVALVDGSHPREKPCGGGVTGRALRLVAPALAGARVPAVTIATARFQTTGAGVTVPIGTDGRQDTGDLHVTSRATFDAALVDAARLAGATIVASRVIDVERGPASFTLRTTHGDWQADGVVGADGANSLVRRRLFRPFRRDQLSIATGYFAHGVTSHEIVVRFETAPPGYLWSFPRTDHLAIGICAQADEGRADALRARVGTWIRESGLAGGARLTPYAWPIPSLRAADWNAEQAAGPGWLLVGDAAGLVDPITREGIFFALQSAGFAADALARGDRAAENFGSRLRDEIYPELRHAARLKNGFFRPPFIRLLMRALGQSQSVRNVMVDLVAGRQPYGTLRRRLLGTLELGLAWRLLWMERGR